MTTQTLLKLYFRHAIPMVIAILVSVALSSWLDWEPLFPILLIGIVFGGLLGAIQHAYNQGFKDATDVAKQDTSPQESGGET